VDLMEQELPEGSRVGVLVELGADGGRTGARTESEALAIAQRLAASPVLTLRGVSGYEGALGHDRSEAALEAVRSYCERLAALGASVQEMTEGAAWITAGGSAYPDLVAAAIAEVPGTRAVLRSGRTSSTTAGSTEASRPWTATAACPRQTPCCPRCAPTPGWSHSPSRRSPCSMPASAT